MRAAEGGSCYGFPHMRADPPAGTTAFYRRCASPRKLCGSGSLVEMFKIPFSEWVMAGLLARSSRRDLQRISGHYEVDNDEANSSKDPRGLCGDLSAGSSDSASRSGRSGRGWLPGVLKYEHMQPTATSKIRGATNKGRILDGPSVRRREDSSKGNQPALGVAVARAGGLAGVPVKLYVSNVTAAKLAGVRSRGDETRVVYGPPMEASSRRVAKRKRRVGLLSPSLQ